MRIHRAPETLHSFWRSCVIVCCAAMVAACGGLGAPSSGYAGEWTGTTSQGTTIAFTISEDERVTAISVGYNFGGCSGTEAFSNLSLSIAPDVTCIPGPCPPNVSSYRHLSFSSGRPGPSVTINGVFLSTSRAEGVVAFRNYAACGSATGTDPSQLLGVQTPWTAIRR